MKILKEKERLNKLADVDYEAVNKLKWEFIRQTLSFAKRCVIYFN
jgi:hypothetical protein